MADVPSLLPSSTAMISNASANVGSASSASARRASMFSASSCAGKK